MHNTIHKLIHLSERITKTDMKYLSQGGFWLIFGQVITAVLVLLVAMVFARVLPKEIYGNYKYILSLAGMVGALMLTGMRPIVVRSVARGFEGTVGYALRLFARWSLVGVVITLMAALYYWLNDNSTLALSLVIISIGQPVFSTTQLFKSVLSGLKQFKLSAQYTIIINAVSITLLIGVATLLNNDNVPLLVLTYFAGYAGTSCILLRCTLKKFPLNDRLDKGDISYGKHISAMNVFTTVVAHLDKVLIFQFIGATQVAVYIFAVAMPDQIRILFKTMGSLAFPKLSASKDSRSFKNAMMKSALFTVAIIVVVGLYILFAELIFALLFPAYMDSVIYSQLIALALIPAAFGVLPLQALVAHRAQKKLYLFKIVSALINCTLLIILIPLHGIWGAVIAYLISRIIKTFIAVLLLYFHKESVDN